MARPIMKRRLLTIEELAEILQRPVNTIKNDRVKNPAALPPSVILPGTRCRRWPEQKVEEWLEYRINNQNPPDNDDVPKPPRGRPRRPV